ncbi:TPA: DUF106 domain-containing protein [Candidatus Woesearchaeota archaeon]|nr:DUF106 domain-containing protein [Candidatus Woesearchaeota archaeon]
MSFLDPVLNPVFQPLFNVSPFWAIVVLALLISLLMTLVYKFFTNQAEMKRLRDQQRESQDKMKTLRDKPDEMLKIQKEQMHANLEYMKKSFKPTLITMIPVFLLFGWMATHLSYEPIFPGEEYTVTAFFLPTASGKAELIVDEGTTLLSEAVREVSSSVAWTMKSTAGEHNLAVKSGNVTQTKKVLVTTELKYESPLSGYEDSSVSQIRIDYKKLKPLGSFSIFGWKPGWLGLYVIFSIVFSMALRKGLKLY